MTERASGATGGYTAVPPARRSEAWTWRPAAVLSLGFVALLWVIEFADAASGQRLDDNGIYPRDLDGLRGILFAPLLHANWDHLIANTVPALVLGFLTLSHGIGRGLSATAIIWLVGGVGTWLTGGTATDVIGASVLIFGWLTYVLARGLFTRNIAQILIGLAVFVVYGAALWGVLPSQPHVSWQGHLFGAIGGLLAAWSLGRRDDNGRRSALESRRR